MGLLLFLLCLAPLAVDAPAQPAAPGSPGVALEALQRLKGMDWESNPALRAAVLRIVEQTRGTPQFVTLVQDFRIKDEEPALLSYALQHASETSAVEAMQLVLSNGHSEIVRQALQGTNRLAALSLLTKTGDKSLVAPLRAICSDEHVPRATREMAVRALVQTQEGSHALLEWVTGPAWPEELKALAMTELGRVPWTGVQARLAELRSGATATQPEAVPTIAEFVRMKGDAARGAEVFRRPTVGCSQCHQVNGAGTDFGPDLSEIGTKLAKEAICEAILDPSAGISFGYEGWQLELKNGEEAFGMVVGDTPDEVSVKTQAGTVTRYKKSEIVSKVQQKSSIMPVGLIQTMTRQDFADLLEYLASLKHKENTRETVAH